MRPSLCVLNAYGVHLGRCVLTRLSWHVCVCVCGLFDVDHLQLPIVGKLNDVSLAGGKFKCEVTQTVMNLELRN